MKKYIILGVIILISLSFFASSRDSDGEKVEKQVLKSIENEGKARVIVILKEDAGKKGIIGLTEKKEMRKLARESVEKNIDNRKIKHEFESLNAFSAELSAEEIAGLENDARVEKIAYDYPVKAFLQDSVPLINATKTWALQTNNINLTGKGETICIVDTGIDYTHPDLGNCTPARYEFNGTNESYILETAHPYNNNNDTTWKINRTGYSRIALHFVNISLEYPGQGGWDSTDRIIIYNGNMNEIARYHGINGVITDLWTPFSDSDTIYLRFVTDASVTDYGFYIDKIMNGTTNMTYNWQNCSKIVNGWDFVNNDGNPIDDNGHGTHVAGIAAANGTINGAAPEARLIAMKSLDAAGNGYSSNVIAAIEWCINWSSYYNISVISMSLGDASAKYTDYCDANDTLTTAAINFAAAKNISVLIASGNNGWTDGITAPACIQNATPVGATTKADALVYNRNSLVKLFAPGSSINSTQITGGYLIESGTSMATPHAAGAFAIMNQYLRLNNIKKTAEQIEAIFYNNGKNITESGNNYTRIDVYNAIISIDSSAPNVSLISPANATINKSASLSGINITFRCNATDDIGLKNASFFLWNSSGIYNLSSQSFSGTNAVFEINITNIVEEKYNWNCLFYDVNNNFAFASLNYSFIYDTISPSITINWPVNNSWHSALKANATINENGACYYSVNNGANVSMNSSDSRNFYYLNSSIAGGSYNISYSCNDSTGNMNYSERRVFNIDLSAPNVSSVSPSSGYSATGTTTINFQYNVSDSLNISSCALVINNAIAAYNSSAIATGTNTISYSLSAGSYTWKINCTDEAGNIGNSSSRSLTINSSSSSSSSSSSTATDTTTSTAVTYSPSENSLKEGYTRTMAKDDKIKFSILSSRTQSKENHTLKIDSISSKSVNITISSNPIRFALKEGESKKVNITSSEYYELLVTLNQIINSSAKITIKTINEKMPVLAETNNKTSENITTANNIPTNAPEESSEGLKISKIVYYLVGAVLGIGIIVFAVMFILRRRKMSFEEVYIKMKKKVKKH